MTRLRSIRNSVTLIGGQGIAQVASALTFIILARSLGVERFGHLATLYGAAMFVSVFVEFGSTNYLIRDLNGRPSKLFPGQYRIRMLTTAAIVCASIATSLILPQTADYSLCIGLAFILAQSRYLSAPVRASLHMGRLSVITAMEKIAVLIVIWIVSINGHVTATTFLTTCLIAGVFSSVLFRLCWSRRHVAIVRNKNARRYVSPFAGLRHMGLSSVAIGLQSLDTAAIAATAGPAAAGVYAAVGRWTQPLSLITQAVTQTAYAEMSKRRHHSEALASLRTHMGMLGVAAIPLVLVFVFADSLTLTLLGAEYASSTLVLRILVGAVLFGIINSPLSAFLQARSDEAFTSKVLLVAMPAQLTLMCALSLWGGAMLGAIAVLVVQAGLALTLGLRVRHLNKHQASPDPQEIRSIRASSATSQQKLLP